MMTARSLRPLALILVATVLGTFAGLLLCRILLLNTAHKQLRAYAARLVVHGDALGKETDDVLAAVNNSPHELCSEKDIAFMEGIAFQAHFLKDVGRVRDNAFICSANLDRIQSPVPVTAEPYAVTPTGRKIYMDQPQLIGNYRATGIVFRNAGIIIDESAFLDASEPPMRYTMFTANPQTHALVRIFGDSLSLSPADIFSQGAVLRDGFLYVSACSVSYGMCEVASLRIGSIRQEHLNLLIAFALFGAFVGWSLAQMWVLFYKRERTMEKKLRRAVRRKQLYLVYQPIVSLPSGRMVGVEALIRWTSTKGEQVPPDVFIPIAERAGFIGKITCFVIERALAELGDLLRKDPGFHVAINISVSDLTDPSASLQLENCLKRFQVPAASIVLELTERSTADHNVAIKAISRLRARGHRVHIDDFGTGYSSLSYLKDLKVDAIKLDRSFTTTVGTEAVTASIVPQILAMAATLNLAVVVEGIETEAQAAYFSSLDRPMLAQGWYFSRVLSAEDLIPRAMVPVPALGFA